MPTGNEPVLSGARILLTVRRRGDDLGAALEERGAVGAARPDRRLGGRERPAAATPDPRRCCASDPTSWWSPPPPGWSAGSRRPRADGRRRGACCGCCGRPGWWRGGPRRAPPSRPSASVPDWLGEAETSAEITDFLLAEGVDGARVVLVARRRAATRPVEVALRRGRGPGRARSRPTAGSPSTTVPRCGPRCARWGRGASTRCCSPVLPARTRGCAPYAGPSCSTWCATASTAGSCCSARSGRSPPSRWPSPDCSRGCPATSRLADLVRLVIEELGDDRHALMTGHGLLRLRAGTITLDHRAVAAVAQRPGAAAPAGLDPGPRREPGGAAAGAARRLDRSAHRRGGGGPAARGACAPRPATTPATADWSRPSCGAATSWPPADAAPAADRPRCRAPPGAADPVLVPMTHEALGRRAPRAVPGFLDGAGARPVRGLRRRRRRLACGA